MSKNDLPPSRTAEQFVVRLPDGMRERIAEAAKASGRSMNAEIVLRLQDSFGSVDVDFASEILRENQFLKSRASRFEQGIPLMQVTQVMQRMQEYLAATLVGAIDQLPAGIREGYEGVRGLASAIEMKEPHGISKGFLALCMGNAEFLNEIRQAVIDIEPAIAVNERGEDLAPHREDGIQREKSADPSKKRAPIGKMGSEPTSSPQPSDKAANNKGPVRRTVVKQPK